MPLATAHVQPHGNELGFRFAGVGRRLRGPVVRGDLQFGFPFLSWDTWMVLHHISREPLERNQDGSIPARWIKTLEQRLVPLPSWVGIADSAEHRVPPALNLLLDLGLLSPRKGPSAQTPNLVVSPDGTKFLKAGRAAFFTRTLDCPGLASFDPSRNTFSEITKNKIFSICWRTGHDIDEFDGLGRRLTQRVLEVLPVIGAARMADMEQAFAPTDPHVYVRGTPWMERKIEISSENFFDRIQETEAKTLLVDTLVYPYFLGLVARGITAEGDITWSLTEAGRNWLGLPSDPHPPPPPHIKVTAAFDLFFGRLDATSRAEVSLYTELTGQDHGMVGKLSRSSVQGALAWGLSVQEILASLDGLVASPLPSNVRQTLEDWGRGAQPVRVREGVVLQCPDASSAGTLERLARGAAERLTETLLLLPDRKTLAGLRRKASEAGILL